MRTVTSSFLIAIAALSLGACGGADSGSLSVADTPSTETPAPSPAPGTTTPPAPTPTPTPTPEPTPEPTPLPPVDASTPDCTTDCDFVGLLTDKNRHVPPARSKPALHASYVDPTFGTTVYRVTATSQIGSVSRVRHYYSKQDPFNADGSYAMFVTSDGNYWLYDAATWEPVKTVSDYPHVSDSEPEIQWHPSNPDWFYYINDGNRFARFEISSHTTTILHDFGDDGYQETRARLEGNMDKSGRFYAMIGITGSGDSEAFVYDIENDVLSKRVNINAIEDEGIDWISMSQNGGYVVLMGDGHSYVYDYNMNYKGRLPLGSYGHADLCSLADGREVMVYDGADHVVADDGDRWINMAYLDTVNGNDTGSVVPLVRIGWSTTPHVSCRNTAFPGWALISNQGDGSNNFDKEIFWVKLDGSNEVRRVAHHYSSRSSGGYFAEQHAVTNKHGTKIIFASNYGSGEISAYLVDLTDFRRPQ